MGKGKIQNKYFQPKFKCQYTTVMFKVGSSKNFHEVFSIFFIETKCKNRNYFSQNELVKGGNFLSF